MDLQKKKEALEKLLDFLEWEERAMVNGIGKTVARDGVLKDAARQYCLLIEQRERIQAELAETTKQTIHHEPRRY